MIQECECELIGYCRRYDRQQTEIDHSACKGEYGEDRRQFSRDTWESLRRRKEGQYATTPRGAIPLDVMNEIRKCPHRSIRTGCSCPVCDPSGFHPGDVSVETCYECILKQRSERMRSEAPNEFDHFGLSHSDSAKMSLYDDNGDHIECRGAFAGETLFYIGRGPSISSIDLPQLDGRCTLAVNNAIELYPHPTFWMAVDPPERFPLVPWCDPGVIKLLPRALAIHEAKDGSRIADLGMSVFYFLRGGNFNASTFLTDRTVNWGSSTENGGGRSVLFSAIRIAHFLGFRKIILLGTDFRMRPDRPYADSGQKDETGCHSNNSKYALVNERMKSLRPHLESGGMEILNATPDSGLTAFEFIDIKDALSDHSDRRPPALLRAS